MRILSCSFIITVIVSTMFISCKKEYDLPPIKTLSDAPPTTIAVIKAKYHAGINYRFKADSTLYCVVTADEISGNLYKNIYVRDATGAICVKLTSGSSGRLAIGDSIRINMKDCYLSEYRSLIQIDSVSLDNNVIKLASGLNPQPKVMTIQEIVTNTAAANAVQGMLVRIDNVQFSKDDRNQTFADATGKLSLNRYISLCDDKNTLTVRTGGYANFAGNTIPAANGSVIGIISRFDNTMQLLIRNYSDVNMTAPLCINGIFIDKDFSDNNLTSGGWTSVNVSGTANWVVSSAGSVPSKPYLQISGYSSGANQNSEAWYVSPVIDLSNSVNPVLTFQNAYNYSGNSLKCYVSTDYTLGNPNAATWTELSFNLSSGNWVFVSSGNISLSNYKTATTRIAFKYTSTTAGASTWELDDILVKEN